MSRGNAEGRRLGTAFVLTSTIVAAGSTAVALIGLYGLAGFDPGRDGGFVLIAFLVSWAITLPAGATIGVPVLIGLRRLGLHRRLEALLAAGLAAGILASVLLATAIAGPSLRGDPSVILLGGGSGLAAGALWWRFAARLRNRHG
jgi:hypothetical protein